MITSLVINESSLVHDSLPGAAHAECGQYVDSQIFMN